VVIKALHGRWWFFGFFMLLMGLGGWANEWAGNNTDAELQGRLLEQIVQVAQAIDPEHVKALSFTATDRNTLAFKRLREQLSIYGRLIGQDNLYSFTVRDDSLLFGPHNPKEYDHLMVKPHETVYRSVTAEFVQFYQAGKPFLIGPRTLASDDFVMVGAPVLDPRTDQTLMMVGLNIPVAEWNGQWTASRWVPLLGTTILLGMLLGGANILRWRKQLSLRKQQRLRHVETVLVGTVGLIMTLAIFLWAQKTEEQERQSLFNRLAEMRLNSVRKVFIDIHRDIATLADFYEVSQPVDRAEFEALAGSIASNSTVQAYEWIPRVPATEKKRFEARIRQEGIADFTIWQHDTQGKRVPASGRREYFPVYRVEPLIGNEPALGFDLGSEPNRRTGLEKATRTGWTTATTPVTLVQETEQQQGVLVFHPVFTSDAFAPDNFTATRSGDRLQGFAVGVLRFQSLLEQSLRRSFHTDDGITVELVDLTADRQPTLLASISGNAVINSNAISAESSEFQAIRPLFAFDRAYAIITHSTSAFRSIYPPRAHLLTVIFGLFLTMVLTMFVGFLRSRQIVLERQVWERTTKLREREAVLRSITDAAWDAILMIDPMKRLCYWNPAAERLFGYSRGEVLGQDAHTLLSLKYYREADRLVLPDAQLGEQDGIVGKTLDLRARRKDGREIAVAMSLSAVHIQDERYIVGVVRDETERQAREQELHWLATTDPLTGVANRRHFVGRLKHELAQFQRFGRPAALLMLDLDRFKQVNDTHGHASGDAVLRHFANIALHTLRQVDMLGRLGGEEFAALLPGTSPEGAQQLAERLRQTLAASPIAVKNENSEKISCTVSIGITLFSSSDSVIDTILSRADQALYRAKDQGRNRVEIEASL
jgi:diguanylate cyclase (GGDEF)-like protein/PAS domain S-box-containing protein